MKVVLRLVVAALQTQVALASPAPKICDNAALRAAETHGIPPPVMLAITRVETGRTIDGTLQPWPWAVNQEGRSHWFDTPEDAEDFVRTASEAGHSNIDVGCFQLNLHWHGGAFDSFAEMFDPTANADYAARFLLKNYERKGNWVDAVAAYHSATPEHALAYIEKVERILQDLAAVGPLPELETAPANVRPNLFPLLQPGTPGALASLVPDNRSAVRFLVAAP